MTIRNFHLDFGDVIWRGEQEGEEEQKTPQRPDRQDRHLGKGKFLFCF